MISLRGSVLYTVMKLSLFTELMGFMARHTTGEEDEH